MKGLEGKRAIVTGGGSGIGEAICRRFAEEGVSIAIVDRDRKGAERVAAMCEEVGVETLVSVVDISEYGRVASAVEEIERDLGPVDILVNNAGWDRMVSFLDSDESLRDEIIAINLKGPLNVTHVVAKRMAERRFGRVVSISSDAGRVGSSGQAVYSACKGGIVSLTKTLARELAGSGILLNAVCPGPTHTPLMDWTLATQGEGAKKILDAMAKGIPLRRIGEPEDVAGIVVFLASEDAGFITGQVVSVSGGLTMHG